MLLVQKLRTKKLHPTQRKYSFLFSSFLIVRIWGHALRTSGHAFSDFAFFPSHSKGRTVDQMDVYPGLVGPLLHYCNRIQIPDFHSLDLFFISTDQQNQNVVKMCWTKISWAILMLHKTQLSETFGKCRKEYILLLALLVYFSMDELKIHL